jgi:hypothetical protein
MAGTSVLDMVTIFLPGLVALTFSPPVWRLVVAAVVLLLVVVLLQPLLRRGEE